MRPRGGKPSSNSTVVEAVAFSPDGRPLASASEDKIVGTWDSLEGVMQQTDRGHPDAVDYVTFSPDGRLLASASIGVARKEKKKRKKNLM